MSIKSPLHNMGGWSQFFFFCFLGFSGYILAVFVLLLSIDIKEIGQSALMTRMSMMIQTVCLFLIPALAFAYLCQENPKLYLKADSGHKTNTLFLIFSILLIIVIQPTIYSISYYNQQIMLPESLSSIENWMRELESGAEKSLSLLFVDKTINSLIFNILILAVIAGLAEELFFRGCLQQIIQKIVNNKHAAIWITAVIFSAIHFQFYGFVSRVLLGALLGYLFVWSGRIWVPVIVHTVHNGINVILTHIYYGTAEYEQMENYTFEDNMVFIVPSVILSGIILFIIYRVKISDRISEN